MLFKKLKDAKEGSFKSESNNDQFEMLKSNIARHFNRINGKILVLAETATWYDALKNEKSAYVFTPAKKLIAAGASYI